MDERINKALILAAGLGSRLAPITNSIPKSLVPVNGKPIIFQQIDNLLEYGIDDITVVSGYKHDILEETVHNKYPNINIVHSIDYASTNNMYSAFLGIKSMFKSVIGGFYMMNADVYFDSSVIATLKEDPRENLIVVDKGRYMEESMKVQECNGRLVAISKAIPPQDALGCSIDVYKFGRNGAAAFFNHCSNYIEKSKQLGLWSEVALNDAFQDEKFCACFLVGRWFEIDNFEDLSAAEQLFKE